MNRLDRLLFLRVASNTALIAIGTTILALGLEMIMEANQIFGKSATSGSERFWLITSYYGYKIAPTISPLLPLSILAGTLITFTAMLRRNELIILVSGGLSLRKVTRSLLSLALLVGCVDFVLVDQIMPSQEGDRLALENQLTGQQTGARQFETPNGLRWAARGVTLAKGQPPEAYQLLVVSADHLLTADKLTRTDDEWVLQTVTIADRGEKQEPPRYHTSLVASGRWELPYSPDQLRATLASSQALPSNELWQRGSEQNQITVYSRFLHITTALSVLLAALPTFVRYQNRTNLISAAGKTMVVGLLAWGCNASMASLAGVLPVPTLVGIGCGLFGLWTWILIRYWRWSL